MSATATVTKTATTAQLTAVALHTLDASHASVSVSWVTNRFTTYFGQYVVGETDAGGKFRTDRPIETWSANAFAQKFFEPGATGTSADRLVCESQVGVTLQPRPTTSLGYGVQECAQVHINPSNGFFTTTGSTTITPQPISTFRNVVVTTSTMYKDSFKEAGKTLENIIRTRIIIGVVIAVVVALLGALATYLRRRKSTKGYMFKKPKGHVHTTSDSVEEGKLQPDNSQIFYPPQQPYQPAPQGYPVPPGPPPPQGYYGAPPPPGGYYVPPLGGPPPPGQPWQPPPAFNS